MWYITLIGLVAAAITTGSLSPQILKIIRTKSTKDISLGTYALFSIGVFLWFSYGLLQKDTIIILANGLGFIQGVIILLFKLKYH